MTRRPAPHSFAVAIQRAASAAGAPSDTKLRAWAKAALANADRGGELTIRIVDITESAALNLRYRGKAGPTNVLSFPAEVPDLPDSELLPIGDVVVCAEVVAAEAAAQGKALEAHWAHMVVHGVLHLSGYDHEAPRDAREMESLECKLLKAMGFQDPWVASRAAELQDTT